MLFSSRSPEYASSTSPHNSLVAQAPFAVAQPSTAEEVADVVREAATSAHEVVVQATGHGAGSAVGAEAIILDTSRVNTITVDPATRIATVGSGAVWADVNAEAERHGLLGLSGSAPSVAVSGYTFGGGLGWLSRSSGMASAALRRVTYVDGAGALRVASDDAADALDRNAIWVFRGGGGVGIAVELQFDLAPIADLHAGYLLWPAEALHDVVTAWAAATADVGAGVASSISVLRVPPAPGFPEEVRGAQAVHLAIAAPDDPQSAEGMLAAVRGAATPLIDTWGPADAARLSGIHLDPPMAIPAYGDARWFTAETVSVAAAVLSTALAPGSPIAMMELRHVAGPVSPRPGAVVSAPTPFVFHAVGAVQSPGDRASLDAAFALARSTAAAADTGRPLASWMEGASDVPESLPPADLDRAAAIADQVDPGHRIRRPRGLPR